MILIWIMITRKQARNKALNWVNEIISKEGGKSIAVKMPRKGKCTWTWNEYKQAIIHDSNLFDGKKEVIGTNPIDDFYRYLVYEEEHKLTN